MNNRFYYGKTIQLLLVSILFSLITQAQSYKIGDTIKPFTSDYWVNGPSEKFNSEAFKGKAILLDFWATWCSPCISYFPKIDSLKKKFANDLIIVGVSYEKQEVVSKFLDTYKKNFGIALSSITEDKELKKMFPHLQIPHYIWINKKGIISAITNPEHLSEDNIRMLVNGGILQLPVKNEGQDIATHKVLHNLVDIDKIRGFPSLIAYSYLGTFQKDVSSHNTAPIFDQATGTTRIKAINVSMSALYKHAFLNLDGVWSFHNKRVIYEGFSEPLPDYNLKQNLFSFDQITKENNEKEALYRMKKTLDDQFNISSRMETRMVESIVLTVKPGYKISDPSGKAETIETPDSIIRRNVSIGSLLMQWNGNIPLLPYPIVNETGFDEKKKTSITLPRKTTDYDKIKAAFEKAGLILTKQYRKMSVIVLSHN